MTETDFTPSVDEKANILIVDDRSDKRLVFQTILEDLGQNIVTARSGEEALRWLLENECAVILLDVNMPGMDGLETAEMIRGRRKSAHTPIIFITAYADEMHTARGYTLGAVDYILAPVLPNVLRSKVNALVRLFNLTAQVKRQAEERIALEREQTARLAAEEAARRATFLVQLSEAMSSSLSVDAILTGANQMAVPFLADFSTVILIQDDGAMGQSRELRSTQQPPLQAPEKAALDELLTQTLARVAVTGTREIVSHFPAAALPTGGSATLPFEQIGVFPLFARGRTRGALVLGLSVGRKFGPADLSLAEDVAARVAMSLDNCMLFQEVQLADRRKNEFLATLSHELRNPLAPLRTALHAMRVGGSRVDSEGMRNMMQRQVDHISHLVDDLLDVARISSGKVDLRKERVDVAAAIGNVLETCRTTEGADDYDLSVSLPQEPLIIEADRIRLQQILENLLLNALKYTAPHGRIGVSAAREGNQALIRVWDTGVGIAPDMLPRIWDLFAQVDNSTERKRGGLGIGLSLAQSMVRLHGGTLEASSDGLGKGSVFTVRLPCVEGPIREREREEFVVDEASKETDTPKAARRVLVVDDNFDAAESLGMVLNLMGHQAELAGDGPEALRMAADFHPEIIFLDIGLPGMSGYEIAERIRKDPGLRDAHLIALSGFGTEEDRRRSVASGFDAHIVKPLDPNTLPDVLARFAGKRPKDPEATVVTR